MKPLKKAEQKNVIVDVMYYTNEEYKDLEDIDGVGTLKVFSEGSKELVVFLEYAKDLKVALDEYGQYCNVAVMKSGETIHVIL